MSTSRLDGWKSIGAHFGRDRTIVMRWARERGLPVKRIPGGKTGTVYAIREELDRWAASQSNLGDDATGMPAAPAGFRLVSRQLWIAGAVAGLVVAGIILSIVLLDRPAPSRTVLPSDPAVSAAYLKARDDWAQRTPERLTAAIAGFELTALSSLHASFRQQDGLKDKAGLITLDDEVLKTFVGRQSFDIEITPGSGSRLKLILKSEPAYGPKVIAAPVIIPNVGRMSSELALKVTTYQAAGTGEIFAWRLTPNDRAPGNCFAQTSGNVTAAPGATTFDLPLRATEAANCTGRASGRRSRRLRSRLPPARRSNSRSVLCCNRCPRSRSRNRRHRRSPDRNSDPRKTRAMARPDRPPSFFVATGAIIHSRVQPGSKHAAKLPPTAL